MKTITLAAAMLLASTAAYAGGNSYNFEIQGQKIHVEAPKNCASLSCIQITAPGLSGINLKGMKFGRDDDDVATTSTPATPPAPPVPPAPAPATQTTATASQSPTVNYPPPPAPVSATDQPTLHDVVPGAPQPPAVAPPAPPLPPAPAPVAAAAQPVTQQPVAAAAPTTPIGLWATEDGKGNVNIEQCGANLCGYTTDTHEKILINMKPEESKWTGRIHDPDSGRDYDSTIAMKGPNLLRVQGCAFGGLFCGGQTWKRIS